MHFHCRLARGAAAVGGFALAALLQACGQSPSGAPAVSASAPVVPASAAGGGAGDPYDMARMDFKTPPAVLSSERHTGAFAAGAALSMDAAVKRLDSSAVKEIRLDTAHKIIEIAPGVRFSAWTFGDQVPGPVVRARVGDLAAQGVLLLAPAVGACGVCVEDKVAASYDSQQSPQAAAAALQQAVPRSRAAIVRLVTARELAANAAGR